ncbi:hypothetical protein ACFL5F_02615 [Planctomycetota bacterium]
MNKTIKPALLLLVMGLCTNVANADLIFGTPTNLGPNINTSSSDAGPSMSTDGLELYLDGDRPGGYGSYDLWISTRATTNDPWGDPINLGPSLNTSVYDFGPSISANGLEIYFSSNRGGAIDIWVAMRATISDTWEEPVNLGPAVNSSSGDIGPSISADGLELYFGSDRSGGLGRNDLWVTKRETIDDPWSEAVNLGVNVNSSVSDNSPCISSDGLLLFFESKRPDGYGDYDIWLTRRATKNDDWSTPVNLGPTINSAFTEYIPGISPDGRQLYFIVVDHPDGFGGYDIWQASIDPVVDLNSDGIVDSSDMCIMVDYWGTDEPLCDIGPMPWGDGIVDVQDLIVLAEHLFEDYGGTVIERRISASSDDAEEALNAGFTNWNDSSDLEIVDDHIDNGGRQLIGLTFRDIYIAPGEVISNAYIEFVCDEIKNGTDDAYFLIWGHLIPNSEGFIEPYVISDRLKTEAKVPWESDPWNALGQKIQTVNIASIIQELIDQEGWAAGNAVEIIIGADPSKPEFAGVRCAESYDGSPSNAPLLHIEIAVP